MNFLAQLETGISFVDKASVASDRWLFLAAIVFIIAVGSFVGWKVVTFLIRSIEEKDKTHAAERVAMALEVKTERETAKAENRAEREVAKQERKADQAEFLRLLDALKGEIKLLAETVTKNTDTLQRHDTDMRAAHALEIGAMVKAELTKLGIDMHELPFKPK